MRARRVIAHYSTPVRSTTERTSHDTNTWPSMQLRAVLVALLLPVVVGCTLTPPRSFTILGRQSRQLSARGAVMVPHILIVDSDSSAAQVTRAVVVRALPEATVAVAPTFERALLS